MSTPRLSIVVPMYNERENVENLIARLEAVLENLVPSYEIVCVNDGSTDDTLEHLLALQATNLHLVVVDLARNFGKEVALTAGLDHAHGDAVVPIDADLQDPPELIGEFLAKWEEGFEVVYAQREARDGETVGKLVTANLFYRIINRLSQTYIPPNAGDYRLMDRSVVEALKRMPERARFMKGLFSWVGFRQTSVGFRRDPRQSGTTKWNYLKLWRFALDAIFSFSTIPLKIWSYLGAAIAALSFGYMMFLLVRTIVLGVDVPGYASMMVVVLFLGGIQLLGIGILGEYVSRIFDEVKQRPLYFVRQVHLPRAEKKQARAATS